MVVQIFSILFVNTHDNNNKIELLKTERTNKTRLLYIYNIIWYIYWRGARNGVMYNIEEACMHLFDNRQYVLDQNAQCTFYQLGAFDKHNYNLYTYI